jgi:AcrR family transcriptional regulator
VLPYPGAPLRYRESVNGAVETRERILAEAIKVIDEKGEPAVRVAKVANAAGVTQGMVTYHFETRERLVAEAHARRFGATMNADNEAAAAAVAKISSADEVRAIASKMTKSILTAERSAARRVRVAAIGYATANDELQQTLTAEHTRLVDEFTNVFALVADKGLLKPGLDPRAVATMASAYTFGLVLTDFDERAPKNKDLQLVIETFLTSVLVD